MSGEMRSRVDWPAFAVQLKREFDERCAIAARSEWRLGRGNGLAIYAMRGYDRDEDIYVGQMLTPELAAAVVEQHNAAIRQGPEDVEPNQDAEEVSIGRAARSAHFDLDAEEVEPTLGPPSVAGGES